MPSLPHAIPQILVIEVPKDVPIPDRQNYVNSAITKFAKEKGNLIPRSMNLRIQSPTLFYVVYDTCAPYEED